MVRPVSFKGFQGVSLRGFRGFQIFLWELCVCIKYLSLGDPGRVSGVPGYAAEHRVLCRYGRNGTGSGGSSVHIYPDGIAGSG